MFFNINLELGSKTRVLPSVSCNQTIQTVPHDLQKPNMIMRLYGQTLEMD